MGNLLTREIKRDFVHLSEHSDFKTALRAAGELLDTYAQAEKLRVERKQRRMRERELNHQRGHMTQHDSDGEDLDPRMRSDLYEEHVEGNIYDERGHHGRRPSRRRVKAERPVEAQYWPPNEIPTNGQYPYADRATPRGSGDLRSMQARGSQHGPYASPRERFRDLPPAGEYDSMNPPFTRRRRQASGMQNRQPDAQLPYSANLYEEERRAQGPHQPNAQRRRTGRRNTGISSMEGSFQSIDSRSGASGSRSGQGRPFAGPAPEAGGSEDMGGPKQRHREVEVSA